MVLPLKKRRTPVDSTNWTYSAAMPTPLTDAELKQAMKAIAAVAGLHLSDERIERDLAAYKGHLAAIESIRGVELPIEAEPASVVVLEQA